MSKKKQKQIDKNLDDAFIATSISIDKKIRDAVYRNITKVVSTDIHNVYKRVMKIMKIKEKADSKYYDFNEFKVLLSEARVLTKRTSEDLEPFDFI